MAEIFPADRQEPGSAPDEVTPRQLPLDLHPDAPVPFRLTPKARRLVAPESLPDLTVVSATAGTAVHGEVPTDLDDPTDHRSARARALRRGGMAVGQIARELQVDELVVRSWTGNLSNGVASRAHRHVAAASRPVLASPDDDPMFRRRRLFRRERLHAADTAVGRFRNSDFLRGLALTVACAEIDLHAVLVSVQHMDVARPVRAWLGTHAGASPTQLRVILRLGSRDGADLLVHRWAEALDVPVDRVSRTLWRGAPSEDAVQALIRVADTAVAARVAGWRDVLLGTQDLPRPVSGH